MDASRLLTDTITIASKTGRAGSGNPTYGAQTTIKCRWEKKSKLVVNASGSEEVAMDRVISNEEIPLLSQVWLPGADTTDVDASKKPIAVGRAATPGGYVLYEAWL